MVARSLPAALHNTTLSLLRVGRVTIMCRLCERGLEVLRPVVQFDTLEVGILCGSLEAAVGLRADPR